MLNSISFKRAKIKEYLVSLLVFAFFFLLIIFSKSCFNAAKEGTELFIYSILPSIFPFLVFSNILINIDILNIINKLFNPLTKKIFRLPGISSIPIFLGLISGYPIGAKVTNDLYIKNMISRKTANTLLAFTNNSSPLFILSFVGISLYHDIKTGLLLLLTHVLSAIIVGIIFGFLNKNSTNTFFNDNNINNNISNNNIKKSFSKIFINSIKGSVNTILLIGGFIVFFSVIINILSNSYFFEIVATPINIILKFFRISTEITIPTLQGLIEITHGTTNLYKINTIPYLYKISLTSFILGTGGLSIYMQLCAIIVDSDLSSKKYIFGKLLQGIIAFILTLLFILYTPFFNLSSIETYTKPMVEVNRLISKNELNIFLDIITLFFIFCVIFKMYIFKKDIKKKVKDNN